jgi:RNA polymerase sigma-70 factor (ECF subfamily)
MVSLYEAQRAITVEEQDTDELGLRPHRRSGSLGASDLDGIGTCWTLGAAPMKPAAETDDQPAAEADAAMSRYADGEDELFGVVYDVVAPRLERYLLRHLRNQALVDDIIQQTFMQMHAKRGTFRKGSQVLPWAYCIARNFMIDTLRKTRREASADDVGDSDAGDAWMVSAVATGEQIVEAHQTRQRIVAVFAGLTDHQRAAYELTKGDGLSQADAAQILGTTVMGIKQCVHKVSGKLRRAFEDEELPVVRTAAVTASAAVGVVERR